MDERWTPRRQGDAGEMSAMQWLVNAGADVYLPVGHAPDYDLIADTGSLLLRVQVKTSSRQRKDRWEVSLATRGGNQSWSGRVKVLDPTRCDILFVVVGDGRRWFIPTGDLGGSCGIRLGGPKYAELEVEPGDPLPPRTPAAPGSER